MTAKAPYSSEPNAYVESRFGSLFALTRVAISQKGLPNNFLSLACLDVIEKANFMPIKRQDGSFKALNQKLPCIRLQPKKNLPFGHIGYIVDNKPSKKKLKDRALKARYLKTKKTGQYLVLIISPDNSRLIRVEEFLVV